MMTDFNFNKKLAVTGLFLIFSVLIACGERASRNRVPDKNAGGAVGVTLKPADKKVLPGIYDLEDYICGNQALGKNPKDDTKGELEITNDTLEIRFVSKDGCSVGRVFKIEEIEGTNIKQSTMGSKCSKECSKDLVGCNESVAEKDQKVFSEKIGLDGDTLLLQSEDQQNFCASARASGPVTLKYKKRK